MLLLDDDDALPDSPTDGEVSLMARLGPEALDRIDSGLAQSARERWHKVARVVSEAMDAGGFDPWDDDALHLHVRRVLHLVEAGVLEAQGNVHRSRWSEVRRAVRETV